MISITILVSAASLALPRPANAPATSSPQALPSPAQGSAAPIAQAPAAPGAQAPAAPATLLHLRDGRVQWGSIQSHDPDGFVFARLDTGGIARLSWPMLDPAQERGFKLQFGYVDLTGDEVLIDADRIVTTDGTELTGLIVHRTVDAILLKTASATLSIRKDRIGGASSTVQVRALDVFSKQELYDQQVLARPPADAASHFALGQFCERILDFARALEHYGKASESDPAFRPADVKLALARTAEKAKNQDQLDYLADVDSDLRQKRYDKALVKVDAFKEKFPSSALIPEAKKKHDRILKARDRDVAERVARLVSKKAASLAHKAGIQRTFDEGLAYVEEPMKQELLDAVLAEVKKVSKETTPDMVRQMWTARKKGRRYTASYGLGTWLLGRDGALKGLEADEKEKKDKKPETEIDKQRADLEKKIKLFLQNQEMARRARGQDEQGEDHETFWKEFPAMSRGNWLFAYFVENSGLFEVTPKPQLEDCPDCGGQGMREVGIAGANVAKSMIGKGVLGTTTQCPICHGVGKIRRISYR